MVGKGEQPTPREGHSSLTLYDRYIFIYGGWNGKIIYGDIYIFDTETKIWAKIDQDCLTGNVPTPRESQSCSLVQNQIYIFGG